MGTEFQFANGAENYYAERFQTVRREKTKVNKLCESFGEKFRVCTLTQLRCLSERPIMTFRQLSSFLLALF